MMQLNVELISIGCELLSGRTLNSHAQTLGGALTAIGLNLSRDTTVPDEIPTIRSAVREALERTDCVVVSGGLGPTSDDITREALAGLFNCNAVVSEEALAELHRRYAERGRTVTPASERQVLILEGAVTLLNPVGMAPGERLDLPQGKTLFIVPGPPKEFSAVLMEHLIPWLTQRFPEAVPLELRVLTTQGIGESDIVTRLEAAAFRSMEIAIGFYPGLGRVEIRLTAPRERLAALEHAEQILRGILRDVLAD
jgi:molybdenum cofactor synthesis domain-containing protein